jgi:hypothetical protein|tara:strand:+ start:123 stop:650 length:528 start_codon:yes stop_codon:yes gene_type:complete
VAPLLALGAVCLLLSACGLFGDAPPPCPQVSIMDQAKRVTFYRPGPGRDLTDVTYEVEIRDIAFECDYDFDDIGDNVELRLNILFVAQRGPAAEGGRVEMPYFSAVTDPSRRILAKKLFTVVLEFEGNAVRSQVVEELAQTIPFPPGADGSAYKSFIGLQLTPGQLEDLKRERGG